MSFERIAELSDVSAGELHSVSVDGRRILLVRLDTGTIVAFEDGCPERALPLSRGSLDGHLLRCACHGWKFDLTTGASIDPSSRSLVALRVRLAGESVWVDIQI